MPATDLRGEPVAEAIRDEVADRTTSRRDRGVEPALATVLMSEADDDVRFLELKHDACAAVGVDARDRRVPPDASPRALYETVAEATGDPAVDAVFVQTPLPDHVDAGEVRERLDPAKDVDCFHPRTWGVSSRAIPGSSRRPRLPSSPF